MAHQILGDSSHSINSSFSRADWEDHIEDHLAKSQALIDIALQQGLFECSRITQHYFYAILDEFLAEVKLGVLHTGRG